MTHIKSKEVRRHPADKDFSHATYQILIDARTSMADNKKQAKDTWTKY